MPPAHQFQRGLGLADTAFPRDQQTLAIDIHQHTVHGDTGSKLHIQPSDRLSHKCGSGFPGGKNGNPVYQRGLHKDGIRLQLTAKYYSRYIIAHKLVVDLPLSLVGHIFHIAVFHETDDLQPGGIKMLKISSQRQRRTIDIRLCNTDILHINLRRKVFQFHFFDQSGQSDTFHIRVFSCFCLKIMGFNIHIVS